MHPPNTNTSIENPTFHSRKSAILASLSRPSSVYTDASPKGAVDAEIRALVDALNAHPGVVTTSSCAGRVAVFLEGQRGRRPGWRRRRRESGSRGGDRSGAHDDDDDCTVGDGGGDGRVDDGASVGGKGAGGRWLYVSHAPVAVAAAAHAAGASPASSSLHALFGLSPRADAAAAGPPTRRRAGGARYAHFKFCLLYTSPSPRDRTRSRMPSSA